jgi:diacylglycerol kinase (CTP)
MAAWATGVIAAAAFWGYFVPTMGTFPDDPEGSFMFSGTLNLIPGFAARLLEYVGVKDASAVVTGPLALGVVSVWTGLVAAGSELIDLFGWDDNLTIPVLSGFGIWGFLKVFGA